MRSCLERACGLDPGVVVTFGSLMIAVARDGSIMAVVLYIESEGRFMGVSEADTKRLLTNR